jgi:hypothetical protein
VNHEEIQDRLEGYVDETLDRETRREVDAHLATCAECQAILEEVAPVELGDGGSSAWAPVDMRRAVRRSMFRVALDTVLLLIATILVAWLLSLTLLHPLVINRGGRAEAATVATVDLAVMFNPGASLTEYAYSSHLLGRTSQAIVVLPVGNDTRELASIESRIGLFAFGDADGGRLFPFFSGGEQPLGGEDRLEAVADGTVATVQLSYQTPIDLASAEKLAATVADVRVVWAGFSVGGLESGLAPTGVLGYGTCDQRSIDPSGAPGSSGGGSGEGLGHPVSVARALSETVRALGNLVDHPDLIQGIGATPEELDAALGELETPRVSSLVVTGPTQEVLRFIDEATPDAVGVLAIDFMNWFEPLCGR